MADTITLGLNLDASEAIRNSQTFANALKGVEDAAEGVRRGTYRTAETLTKKLVTGIDAVEKASKTLSSEFKNFNNIQNQFNKQAVSAMSELSRSAKETKSAFNLFQSSIQGSDRTLQKAVAAGEKFSESLKKIQNEAEITQKEIDRVNKAKADFDKAMSAARATSVSPSTRSVLTSDFTSQQSFAAQIKAVEAAMNSSKQSYAEAEQQITRLQNAQSRLSNALEKTAVKMKKIDPNSKVYGELIKNFEKLYNAYLSVEKRIDTAERKQVSAASTIKSLTSRHQELISKLNATDNAFNTANLTLQRYDQTMRNLAQTEANVGAQAERVNNRFREQEALRARANVGTFMPNMNFDNSTAMLSRFTQAARSALYAVNAFRIAFRLAFSAVGLYEAVSVVSSFNQTVADMNSIIRMGNDQSAETRNKLEALKATMEDLGATSRYTTTQAGQGMIYMAQSGMTAAEIMQSASNVLDLAVASNTELSRASDIVIQAMRTFGIEAKDAWQVTDTLAMGAKTSVTSIEQLADAMKYVGPIAHTMGVRIDTVVAALGTLSDSGLQASMAGTGLRRIISEIANPTMKAQKILESMGLTMDKLDVQGLGLVKVLENIKAANLSVGQSFAIWGDRGTPALQVMLGNLDKFKEKLATISLDNLGIQGAAHQMREEREDTLQGQWLASISAIQEFIIKFSEYTNAINNGKEMLRNFAVTVRNWNTDIGGTTSTLAGVAAGLLSFLTIGRSTGKMLVGLKENFTKFVNDQRVWANTVVKEVDGKLVAIEANTNRVTVAFAKWAKAGKAMAFMVGTLRSIYALSVNILASLAIPVIIGFFTKWMTATDRAEEAMERLRTTTELYFRDVTTSGNSAKQVMDDYAQSISNLGKTSLEIRIKDLEKDFDAEKKKLKGLGEEFRDYAILSPKWDWNEMPDVFQLLFGASLEQLIQDAKDGKKSLDDVWKEYATGDSNRFDLIKKLGLDNHEKVLEILKAIEDGMQFLTVTNAKIGVTQNQRDHFGDSKIVSKETIDRLKGLTQGEKDALDALRPFATALLDFKGESFAKEGDKISKEIEKLRKEFDEPIADKVFDLAKNNIKEFETYFDFDPSKLTVKIKDEYQKLIDMAANAKDGLGLSVLRQLGMDPEKLKGIERDINALIAKLKELEEIKFEVKMDKIIDETKLLEQEKTLTDFGKKVRTELLKVFRPDQLEQLGIDYNSAFAYIVDEEGKFSREQFQLANDVVEAWNIILGKLAEANQVKLAGLISEMRTVQGLVKEGVTIDVAKKQQKFAQDFYGADANAALQEYQKTKKWRSVGQFSAKDMTDLYKYQNETTTTTRQPYDRKTKLFAEIDNEIKELGLKYQQYIVEMTGGSKKEIELQKLQIEQFKELASIQEKAKSLGVSLSDQRIQDLQAEIAKTYELKEAELRRKADQEQQIAPLKTQVAKDSMYGGNADFSKIQLAREEVKQLEADMQVLQEGTTGYLAKLAEVYAKKSEVFNLETQQKQNELEILAAYEEEFGSISKAKEYRSQMVQLENARLQKIMAELQAELALTQNDKERTAEIQKQLELLQKQIATNDKKNSNKPFNFEDASHDFALSLEKTYGEAATFQNIMMQTFDTVASAISTFVIDGTFELDKFADSLGRMFIELTTKYMLMKAMTSLGWFALGDGGMVSMLADGGMRNITPRKFAGGGLLTRPTMFNTTSGTALAGEAGYEHIMPAARLSNGKWGVYAEGMGGGTNQNIVINNNVVVESGAGTGVSEDDDKLAKTISEKLGETIRQSVQYELQNQMRSGGLLNQSGNRTW